MTKITLVGAGSVEFTRVLLADLAAYPELADLTIALHDIDPGRLDTATRIAARRQPRGGFALHLRVPPGAPPGA